MAIGEQRFDDRLLRCVSGRLQSRRSNSADKASNRQNHGLLLRFYRRLAFAIET